MRKRNAIEALSHTGATVAVVLGFYFSSRYSYLLFHSLVEITTIAVGFTMFILAWNTRRFLTNDYLALLGIGYGFIASIDLLHCLAYKGMNVFTGYDANLPTQLWIAARYLQAVTLCAAPVLVTRRIGDRPLIGIYFAAVTGIVALVYSGRFPDCFVEGSGLTSFKIASEYVITAILVASLALFHKIRSHFNERVCALIAASIICTAGAEISFTAYVSVYGFANMLGHLLKLAAFYLVYRALLVTGFNEPYALIFRDLTEAKEALQDANDSLEQRVRERTEDLKATNENLKEEISRRQETEKALCRLNRELRAISNCNQVLMHAVNEKALLNEICSIVCGEAGYRMAWVGFAENDDTRTVRPAAWAGVEDGYLEQAILTWADTERGRGPAGVAIRSGSTDCSQDLGTDPRMAPWRESALQRGYRSAIALPLNDNDAAVFGVMLIYSSESNAFSPDERHLLEELAGDLAFGIMVLRARAERQKTQECLQAQTVQMEEEIRARRDAQEELERLNVNLELLVQRRTVELEEKNRYLARLNNIFVGRELKMIELKQRVKELENRSGS